MVCPQPLRDDAAPYYVGAWVETPASSLSNQPPPLLPDSLCLCAGQGKGAPRAPTDPPKITSALGARLSGGLGKGSKVFPSRVSTRAAGEEMNCASGKGGRACAPGEGRAVGAGSEVRGLRGGSLSPLALGTVKCVAQRSRGRAGSFQPGRRSAAVASADVEERSAAAGARRPLLFI